MKTFPFLAPLLLLGAPFQATAQMAPKKPAPAPIAVAPARSIPLPDVALDLARPAAPAPQDAAAAAAAQTPSPGPLATLQGAQKDLARAAQDAADVAPILQRLFGESGQNQEPPSPPPSSAEEWYAHNKRIRFPGLSAGQEAPVFIPRARSAGLGAPTDGQMTDQMKESDVMLTNEERMKAAVRDFQLAGARADKIIVLKDRDPIPLDAYDTVILHPTGRGTYNVVVVKEGERKDLFNIVGSHLDKVDGPSHGTIDNWAGTMHNVHVYQTREKPKLTTIHIAHNREEEGLIGSRRFARALKAQGAAVNAVWNVDTIGVDAPDVFKNDTTDERLIALAVAEGKKLGIPVGILEIPGADSDHTPYGEQGIPSATITGLSKDKIFDIIHTARDTMAVFNLENYKKVYRLTLAALAALDGILQAAPARAGV